MIIYLYMPIIYLPKLKITEICKLFCTYLKIPKTFNIHTIIESYLRFNTIKLIQE